MQRSLGSSISHLIESVGKRADSIDEVLGILKNATPNELPNDVLDIFHAVPNTAFKEGTTDIITSSGKRLGAWSSDFRSGLDDIFEQSLRDIEINPSAGNFDTLKKINNATYPDGSLIQIDIRRGADRGAMGAEASGVDALSPNEIDEIAAKPPSDNVMSNMWDKFKNGGKIVLATGAIVGVGLYLSDTISDAIALNSGCFLVSRENNKNVFKRIIGFSCGNKKGDDLWVAGGGPVAPHPLRDYFPTPLCNNGEDECYNYCDTDQIAAPAKEHLELIPDNSSLVCYKASISDVLSDMADSLGTDIGTITGGVVGGITGGIADSLNINFGWLFAIIGIIIAIVLIVAFVKYQSSSKPTEFNK